MFNALKKMAKDIESEMNKSVGSVAASDLVDGPGHPADGSASMRPFTPPSAVSTPSRETPSPASGLSMESAPSSASRGGGLEGLSQPALMAHAQKQTVLLKRLKARCDDLAKKNTALANTNAVLMRANGELQVPATDSEGEAAAITVQANGEAVAAAQAAQKEKLELTNKRLLLVAAKLKKECAELKEENVALKRQQNVSAAAAAAVAVIADIPSADQDDERQQQLASLQAVHAEELSRAQAAGMAAEQAHAVAASEAAALAQALLEAQQTRDSAESEVQQLRQEAAARQAALAEEDQRQASASAELASALAATQTLAEDRQRQLAAALVEVGILKEAVSAQGAEGAEPPTEEAVAPQRQQAAREEKLRLEAEELQAQVGAETVRAVAAEALVSELKSANAALEEANRALVSELETAGAGTDSATQDDVAAQLEALRAASAAQVEEHRLTVQQLTAALEEARQSLAQGPGEEHVAGLEQHLAASQAALQQQRNTAAQEAAELQQQLEEAVQACEAAQQQAESARRELEILQQQLTAVEQEAAAAAVEQQRALDMATKASSSINDKLSALQAKAQQLEVDKARLVQPKMLARHSRRSPCSGAGPAQNVGTNHSLLTLVFLCMCLCRCMCMRLCVHVCVCVWFASVFLCWGCSG